MKRESLKTLAFLGVAAALVAAAVWVEPEARKSAIFSDQGEALFPALKDPLAVRAIEVVDYDEEEAVARPFKVEMRKNRWVLSSHNDYPAEARDRLAKTAGAFVDLKKDITVSDRIEDHGRYGVIDPLDAKVASLAGRGKRVTLRNSHNEVLADFILGHSLKERAGYRYLRLSGQKRTYAVKADADPSARFEDWVESNLLRLSSADLKRITVNTYQVQEQIGRLTNVERTVLIRDKDNWSVEGGGNVNAGVVRIMVSVLGGLRVVGARPKPASLAEALKNRQPLQMSLETVMSLRQRGFFISPDGRLLANEGELLVETNNGVTYALRFGEISGAGEGKPAPAKEGTPKTAAAENRYLFVSASARRDGASEQAGQTARNLDAKFADWYYIISGADFAKLRVRRQDLIR